MKTIEEIKASGRIAIDYMSADGFQGVVQFPRWQGSLIVSWQGGWEHASVAPLRRSYTPSWQDMAWLKDLIWNEEEAVIQVHPPKSQYVNNVGNCLHLWRCYYRDMVLPPSCFVGYRPGQTRAELMEEVKAAYELAGEKFEEFDLKSLK